MTDTANDQSVGCFDIAHYCLLGEKAELLEFIHTTRIRAGEAARVGVGLG